MPTATVKVDFVNPPKEGKKRGSIKGADGKYYWGTPAQIAMFQKGGTYTFEFDSKADDSGKVWHSITKLTEAAGPGAVPASGSGDGSTNIFVTGVVGRYLQGSAAPWPDAADLEEMVRSAKNAWERGMKNEPAQKKASSFPDDELNDEIPF